MSSFFFENDTHPTAAIGAAVNRMYLAPEADVLPALCDRAALGGDLSARVRRSAMRLVQAVRERRSGVSGLDAFLQQYDLSSREGVALMCLAEALLRIPDADTADALIADKLTSGDWAGHSGESESIFVNASTWGLMLTGRLMGAQDEALENPAGFMQSLVARLGEPMVRMAMRQAMRIMGHQFVMGRSVPEAIRRAEQKDNARYRYSFDMLGEAALTYDDAARYHSAYRDAIEELGRSVEPQSGEAAASISVKLSALHPRFEYLRADEALPALVERVGELVRLGQKLAVPLTIDAEEADRLELSLAVFDRVFRDHVSGDWDGLGLAVQTYQKRARDVLEWTANLARVHGRRIPVRLVKGAYWDTEIKHGQEQGLSGFPVFTRKISTDVSFLACIHDVIDNAGFLYPQLATHNAHTVAYAIHVIGGRIPFEFQRLHGMGEELYEEVIDSESHAIPCRVYAPVGRHEDLLPYLVRRLLENGANTSFVNRIVDEQTPVEDLVADPVAAVRELKDFPHPRIPVARDLYQPVRVNSTGVNFPDGAALAELAVEIGSAGGNAWFAGPMIDGVSRSGEPHASVNPANHLEEVGVVEHATPELVSEALDVAVAAQKVWSSRQASERADILRDAADLFESHRGQFLSLCNREAGKSVPDAVAELREAVDFLRYYAAESERLMAQATTMPGPTGEENILRLSGRGVFVCISPWNFPLAIFAGQVAAGLAAGNSVLAKPAEQTSLTAGLAVRLLHKAGVPGGVLQLVPGEGGVVGARAIADPRIAGVAFTGSTDTARTINRTLAARDGPLATLIAETGGQNGMLVDSSALPEQVVRDIVQSAFNSAGQRCSALRVLMIQDDVADRTLELLRGHMETLVVGDPSKLSTDVGPVIDHAAKDRILDHVETLRSEGCPVFSCPLPEGLGNGSYVAPTYIEIPDISILKGEVFGPILHVVRIPGDDIGAAVDAINDTGYGLTLGIHSRIEGRARVLARRAAVGNVYVNRNMIGAVVGVQPFGGQGLSGTGPKAGGPHYLPRFMTEQTISTNTAAVGGNASLLALSDN